MNQDWNEVEALRASLREHMAEIHRLRAAGRQALDALSEYEKSYSAVADAFKPLRAALAEDRSADTGKTSDHIDDVNKMVASVREDRTVEPVAWMVYTLDGQSAFVTDNPADFTPEHRSLPLYTAPPKRQPLTNAEIKTIYDALPKRYTLAMFARAVEQAHGIGGEE